MKMTGNRNSRRGVSRREVLAGTVAIGATLAMPALQRAKAADEVLYVNTWGGTWEAAAREHLFEPFTRETGIEIRTVSPVSYAKLAAQVRSGVYEFDVTTLGLVALAQANQADLLESVEESPLDEAQLWSGAVILNGVSSHAFSTGVAYRNDPYPNGGPQNWAEFWDAEKFEGSRSLQRYPARVLAIALLADGAKPDELFPYDLDRAFKSLDRIKPHVRVWWEQGPQSRQLLRDGEVDLIGIWNTQIPPLTRDKIPTTFVWDGAVLDKALWVVAKGTPRRELGWRFVQFAVQPERLARFSAAENNGPLNPKSLEYLSEDEARIMPTHPENLEKSVVLDPVALGPQIDEFTERFERWLLL
ncbi:MAG: ABC transporter substrate-binding protein [Rhizobiaceae bacterium]